jgi:hypothetical protein
VRHSLFFLPTNSSQSKQNVLPLLKLLRRTVSSTNCQVFNKITKYEMQIEIVHNGTYCPFTNFSQQTVPLNGQFFNEKYDIRIEIVYHSLFALQTNSFQVKKTICTVHFTLFAAYCSFYCQMFKEIEIQIKTVENKTYCPFNNFFAAYCSFNVRFSKKNTE